MNRITACVSLNPAKGSPCPPCAGTVSPKFFLVKVMKYDWATAHGLSDVFEKGVNDELEDRMDELAGHPTRCPHGEPIPSKDGVMPIVKDMPLIDVPSGSDCVISRVRTHDMDKLGYIGELGLVPGASFHLYSCAPF